MWKHMYRRNYNNVLQQSILNDKIKLAIYRMKRKKGRLSG